MATGSAVDRFLADGCGRCELHKTPECKVRSWQAELTVLRELLRSTELEETVKWGQPCYVLDGRNVVILSALRDGCTLGFFDGALLTDPHGLLEAPGPNTRAARLIRFGGLAEVLARREVVQEYVEEAIRRARAGEVVTLQPVVDEVPEELGALLAARPEVGAAFARLTPGRQRSHVLHVAGAKQAATRERRAAKCAEKILAGKGFQER